MTSDPAAPTPDEGAPVDTPSSAPEVPPSGDVPPATEAPGTVEAAAPGAAADGVEVPAPADLGAPATAVVGRRGIRPLGYVLAAIGGIAVAVGALALSGSLSLPEPSPSPSPSPAPLVVERSLGDPEAIVTLEIWADFQCPYCGLQARAIQPSIERLYAAAGRVRMTYRDFAFLGDESFGAAVAARCAGQQGHFWYYHDLLFASQQGENQGAFVEANLVGLAEFAGLDTAAFSTCIADPAVRHEVEDETAEGRQLAVTSTPVIRIEGPGGLQVLTGLKPLSDVEAAIERAEQPAPSTSPSGSSPAPTTSSEASPSPSASPAPTASAEASPSP